jgi:gamma-glutamyltranspeptidase / glutathione hydrolase / leukotriene-C4 hydrolase
MGLMGGFLMTAYIKSEKKSIVVDAQISTPKDFILPSNMSYVKHGPGSVGVPGFLKGLWEIHQNYGSISWKNLIEPIL